MEPWQRLDLADDVEAKRLLSACCGSTRWVSRMMAARPFGSRPTLMTTAAGIWRSLSPDDWQEAFACHPRIGDREALRTRFAATRALSSHEQSSVDSASESVLDALAAGNLAYEARFGYIFIVCASGRTADEMLALLTARLTNDADRELLIAAGEQEQITALRLDRL